MRSLFWTGKLSLPILLLVNANNLLAWLIGNSGNKPAMKERVKLGYEGCAVKAVCGDISQYMLTLAEENSKVAGYNFNRIRFCKLDAESLPFDDNSFDVVLTGMSFGLFPNQKKAVSEMFRVLRPGGLISLGAHGPEHYWEAIDTTIRALNKRHVLGYRFEFWPRTEKQILYLMRNAGFKNVHANRFIWRNIFRTPAEACDFFASVSSNWWYAKIPESRRLPEYQKTKKVFEDREIRQVTDDVIIGYGMKLE
ncbi:MAG: class I SAM-dependent methyltransferase [Bacteroidales bacterium]